MSESSSYVGRVFPLTKKHKKNAPKPENLKRWDGAARASYPWDPKVKDKTLWIPTGNCRVYLCAYGQSRQEPSFKLPFGKLHDQRCSPFIGRYMVFPESVAVSSTPAPSSRNRRSSLNRSSWDEDTIDLYIPPPARANADVFYLSIRNFIAFILRKSIVGQHLGNAIVQLVDSMREYREPGVDNAADLMAYLEEEGYMHLAGQPSHALAMLHVADWFHTRELYVNALAHCVGMAEYLHTSSEYMQISSLSRRQIREARGAMDAKLSQSSKMLRNFLEYDLSEQRLGLTPNARAHLDRFRAFLVSFYANRFGQWPSPGGSGGSGGGGSGSSASSSGNLFAPHVLTELAKDFGRLYDYLVDDRFTFSDSSPAQAQGGICVLQSVEAFNRQHGFEGLMNPLPLLPELCTRTGGQPSSPIAGIVSSKTSPAKSTVSLALSKKLIPPNKPTRRRSWFGVVRTEKVKVDSTHTAQLALLQAGNRDPGLLANSLVAAYRRFEEDTAHLAVAQTDKDKAALVDARKVRWILVYCVYQTLRGCTQVLPEVNADYAAYSLCISLSDLPVWDDETPVLEDDASSQRTSVSATGSGGLPMAGLDVANPAMGASVMNLEPDVDYYALTHPDEPEDRGQDCTIQGLPRVRSIARGMNLPGSFSRSSSRSSFRLSIVGAFTPAPAPEPPSKSSMRNNKGNRNSYQPIVVPGYGNGTSQLQFRSMSAGHSALPTTPTTPTLPSLPPNINERYELEGVQMYPTRRAGLSDANLAKRGSRYMGSGFFIPEQPRRIVTEPSGTHRTSSTSSKSSAGTTRSQADFSTAPTTPLTDSRVNLAEDKGSLAIPGSIPDSVSPSPPPPPPPRITVTNPNRRYSVMTPPLPHRNPARPFSVVGTLQLRSSMAQEIFGVEREFAVPPSPNSQAPSPLRITKIKCCHQKPLGSHPVQLQASPPLPCEEEECVAAAAAAAAEAAAYDSLDDHGAGNDYMYMKKNSQSGNPAHQTCDNDFNAAWDQFAGLGGFRRLTVATDTKRDPSGRSWQR